MVWKKPNILKSRREKRLDAQISFIGTCVGLAVAVRDYNDRKSREELEAENIRLQNELLKKEVEAANGNQRKIITG